MRFSVCIEAVFKGRDFIESMKAVKEAGINAFEFWAWWNKDIHAIAEAKEKLGMENTLMCTKFISLLDPSRRKEYKTGLEETISIAKLLNCRSIVTQVGNEMPGVSRDLQHHSLVQGLKECVPVLEKAGVKLVFEPLNTLVDHKGYYLWSAEEAFYIEAEVGSPNVKVLYDIYHQQIMDGHLISRIQANIGKIGHFHAAGNPGRHEVTTGEINYLEVFKAIDDSGYNGFIGLEYFPLGDPVEGLKKLIELTRQVCE